MKGFLPNVLQDDVKTTGNKGGTLGKNTDCPSSWLLSRTELLYSASDNEVLLYLNFSIKTLLTT